MSTAFVLCRGELCSPAINSELCIANFELFYFLLLASDDFMISSDTLLLKNFTVPVRR